MAQFLYLAAERNSNKLETELTKNNSEICALLDALHDAEKEIYNLKN
nr:MAG TPA: hypothetical protein [Caudoviricetes sp.]